MPRAGALAPRAPERDQRSRRTRFSFRTAALSGTVAVMLAVHGVRAWLWGRGRIPIGSVENVMSYGSLLWALPALGAALALSGFILFPGLPPWDEDTELAPISTEVCFRIVSRGTNPEALRSTVATLRRELSARPLFPHRIEVVLDMAVDLESPPELRSFIVPADYATAHGARYKARALHYAVEHSGFPSDGWIMHLDEESRVTPSLLIGIRKAVEEEERSGRYRIGQGAILYHQNLDSHPILTLADMIRTGDDLGRFYLQHRLGFTLFGLHGSFILARNSVEQRVGFDFGPEGSITEDAFWALRQMSTGARCRWVDGFLLEQSTRSFADFVKQRRRWFSGMIRVVLYAEVQAWIRIPLALFTSLWALSWLSMIYTVLNLAAGFRTGTVVSTLGDFSLAVYLTTYLIGLHVNLAHQAATPRRRKVGLYILQVLLLPAFAAMEAAGVVLGFVRSEREFYIVKK